MRTSQRAKVAEEITVSPPVHPGWDWRFRQQYLNSDADADADADTDADAAASAAAAATDPTIRPAPAAVSRYNCASSTVPLGATTA